MDIRDKREEALRELLAECGGVSADLARRIKKSPQQISQWLSGYRTISEDSAREIEVAARKPFGWLDRARGGQTEGKEHHSVVRLPGAKVRRHPEDQIEIPQFDAGGRMGVGGLVLQDQPGVIHNWHVTAEWLSKNVRNASTTNNLCIVTGFGDSMKPLYNPGDPLLVDVGVTEAKIDAVYFFRVGDEGFIKRLQRVPGSGILALSENKSYRDWTITPDMDFEVIGRVLKIWKGEDF